MQQGIMLLTIFREAQIESSFYPVGFQVLKQFCQPDERLAELTGLLPLRCRLLPLHHQYLHLIVLGHQHLFFYKILEKICFYGLIKKCRRFSVISNGKAGCISNGVYGNCNAHRSTITAGFSYRNKT